MRWWSKFWKRRKQDDRIKMIFVFLLVALVFLGKAVYTGVQLYCTAGERTEYILQATAETGITDREIRELEHMEEVECVSRQLEKEISIMAGDEEAVIPCVGISKEYMERVWNVSARSAMRQLFLNASAEKLLNEKGVFLEEKNARVMFSVTDAEGVQTNEMAEVFRLENMSETDMPYAFCVLDNAKLLENLGTVRVEMKGKELDGQQLEKFRQMGYLVVNEAEQNEEKMRREVKGLKIRYDVGVVLLCAIAARCLQKD